MGDRRHDIVGQRILNSGALCQEDPFLGEFFQPKFSSFSVERDVKYFEAVILTYFT